jgi:hypothetical protein
MRDIDRDQAQSHNPKKRARCQVVDRDHSTTQTQGASAPPPPKNKREWVGCFYVGCGIAFFWPFLLRIILTPPARYQHPHGTNNPPVGHWGNCEPKWWPQDSSVSSKTKQRTHKAKRSELNGLVVHVDVRIGLTLYGSSCSTRYELNIPITSCFVNLLTSSGRAQKVGRALTGNWESTCYRIVFRWK